MRIILIRHGQSTGNTERRFQGQSKDPRFHLTELGKQQARKLKQRFINENIAPTHIYSSPLKRVKETAEIIADGTNIAIQYSDDLQEYGLGILTGMSIEEASNNYKESEWEQLEINEYGTVEGAETIEEKLRRAKEIINRVIREHNDEHTVFLVCHGGFLQDVIANILETPKRWRISIKNTAIFDFSIKLDEWAKKESFKTNRFWQINSFNDHTHLL
ncbi:MAG: histidine phosphatase family protein [SAR202 cluster bacterium]|nr:histidine phosphatase family protein [SAR202 cluster bacterium]|tara:strand:- start:3900 stop:4550 length:651 start_codon:yes stop_codon:yes gene_type:complete